jgi:hypothetical protein
MSIHFYYVLIFIIIINFARFCSCPSITILFCFHCRYFMLYLTNISLKLVTFYYHCRCVFRVSDHQQTVQFEGCNVYLTLLVEVSPCS